MQILILGSGGREHALAWKISQSPLCTRLFIAPGNPGTASLGQNLPLPVNDFEAIKAVCLQHPIEMLIVGPEDPLVEGIVDFFNQDDLRHIHVIGPSAEGAKLEGSKAFAKEFMHEMSIPTARYKEFNADRFAEGVAYLRQHPMPVVLKADGLAAGKGVVIAQNTEEAIQALTEMIQGQKFGAASSKVVIEEFLTGIECSVFVLTDGKNYQILPVAKDYKRIGEGDTGLNTGGMGAISPVPFADEVFMQKVKLRIIEPTMQGLSQREISYKGFIFIGLISVAGEPHVIEYNCRMGDPETEVVMPRIANDLMPALLSLKEQKLDQEHCEISPMHAATVMLVSGGYPEAYQKGKLIQGLELLENCLVFHAGTRMDDGQVLSNGGRVMAITALGHTLKEALSTAKQNVQKIRFDQSYFRTDIGWEFE
jgi:phosphoribosylamine--glycine ligase